MKRHQCGRWFSYLAAVLAGCGVLTAGVILSTPTWAATETYAIDVNHSRIGFSIRQLFVKVQGRFVAFEGRIEFDPDDLSSASVVVSIDASSINTDNAKRDEHLRSADFFDVASHPRITFRSTRVVPSGPNKGQLEGILTMHGVSMPVTLDVELLGTGPDFWGGYRGGFEGHATVNRKDFEISWNQVLDSGGLLLGEDVDILINIEGIRQEPTTEPDAEPESASSPPAE